MGEINEDYKYLKSSEVLELQEIIPLETTAFSLIGEIERIRVKDSLIFVMDRTTKAALLFDNSGKFISTIGVIGKGPHEIIELTDIEIDNYAKRLLLLDCPGKKIVAFSYDGKFEGVISLSDWFDKIFVLNTDELLLYSGNNAESMKRFTIIDKHGEVISKFNKIPHTGLHEYRSSILAGNPDTLLYAIPFDNTLYSVKNGKQISKYRIDFDGRFITAEAKSMRQAELEKVMNKDDDGNIITQINHVFTVNNVLYFSFNHHYQEKSALFDLQTNKLIKVGEIKSDINNLIFPNKPPIGQTNDKLVYAINPIEQIPRYERLKEKPEYANHLKEFSSLFDGQNITKTSNPILFFYTIKHN